MNIDIHILQKLVDGAGEYFLCQRRIEGRDKPRFDAWILSPSVPAEMQGNKVGELPFNQVYAFARTQTLANIAIGKSHPPFQWGVEHGSIVFADKVTCDVMKLVVHCYIENITDHYEATKIMKQMTEDETPL